MRAERCRDAGDAKAVRNIVSSRTYRNPRRNLNLARNLTPRARSHYSSLASQRPPECWYTRAGALGTSLFFSDKSNARFDLESFTLTHMSLAVDVFRVSVLSSIDLHRHSALFMERVGAHALL